MEKQTINPSTGEALESFTLFNPQQIEESINLCHSTFYEWSKTSFSERATLFKRLADVLEDKKEELARKASLEMGKPIKQARAEVEKCQWVCQYYADNAETFLAPQSATTNFESSKIHFSPIGIVLAVMPWNYPFWQVFRFAAPTMMAGNTALLKHSSNVLGCAQMIEDCFKSAGFPEHSFINLPISSKQVEMVIANPKVRATSVTGSVAAGRSVAKQSGDHLKKSVLELGGSDAYLILQDADLSLAAEKCASTRLQNTGQSCVAGKRFLVVESVYSEFLDLLKAEFEKKTVGPSLEDFDLGPMARHDLRDEIHKQVTDSISKGARLIVGGEVPDNPGAFYPPTILADVPVGSPAYEEELFGPVASVIPVKDWQEAVEVSNKSSFGLGGGIFSRDIKLAEEIASKYLDTGAVFINDFVKSDPRLPFGGVKQSGYGRELSHFGILEFVNIKTICVNR